MTKNDPEQFVPFVEYILRGSPRPMKFAVFVQLIIPTQVPEHIQKETGEGEVFPNWVRIGKGSHSERWKFDLLRRLGIKSYDFYLVGSNDTTTSEKRWRSILRDFEARGIPGARRLHWNKSVEPLRASLNDAYGSAREFLLKNRRQFFERRTKRI